MKKLLLIYLLSFLAINIAGAQTKSTESSVLKVAGVSVYSDTYNYTFGNPIKLNGNRKSGFASGVMSLMIPGLGQFYNGDEVGGTAYLLANILTKVWLICPPQKETTKNSIKDGDFYVYTEIKNNYTAPIVANIAVAIVSVIDAAIMSKRVTEARDGYRISGNSYLKVEPTVMSSTALLNYSYNDLAYGVNCSLKF